MLTMGCAAQHGIMLMRPQQRIKSFEARLNAYDWKQTQEPLGSYGSCTTLQTLSMSRNRSTGGGWGLRESVLQLPS